MNSFLTITGKFSVMIGTLLLVFGSCERHSELTKEIINNNNNNHIQRRYSRFLTISSKCSELSPTPTLKWPGRNPMQITCNTSSAYHVQVSCYVPLGMKGQLSYYVWQSLYRIDLSFILLAEPLNRQQARWPIFVQIRSNVDRSAGQASTIPPWSTAWCYLLLSPPQEWKVLGSNPACAGIFYGVESYQWLKHWHSSGYPARRLAL